MEPANGAGGAYAFFDYSAFPTLSTPRLILRELTLADAPAVFEIRRDYEVTKYNSGFAYVDVEEAAALIGSIRQDYELCRAVRWGITLRAAGDGTDTHSAAGDGTAGAVIGMVGFNYWNCIDNRASVGYDLARAHWGQGLMPEALRAVITFGFRHMALNRVEADTSVENVKSVRVLHKLGFRQEGHQREQYFDGERYQDLLLFGLLRRDFLSG